MAIRDTGSVRALALVGPTSAGKTALMEALLKPRPVRRCAPRGGRLSPEAKAHGHFVR